MNKSYLIVGLVILLAVGGVGYFAMTNKQMPAENTVTETSVSSSSSSATNPGSSISSAESTDMSTQVKEITVEAGSFYYKPNAITVKKGDKVKIVMNSVSMMHDFVIDELNVKMPIIKNGDTGTVEFTADKAGSFEYYCSVGQHRANGQVGTLTVEE